MVMIFGEIVLVFTSEQHIHVHKPHVHHHNDIQESQASYKEIERTTKVDDLVIREHVHNFQSKSTNIAEKAMQDQSDPSNKERRTISDNKTEDKKYKPSGKVPTSHSKYPKRLMFKNDVNPIVRQHAAKSIKLDCYVKGVSKYLLTVRWLKDGVPIKDIEG